jgi:hypothetical protein
MLQDFQNALGSKLRGPGSEEAEEASEAKQT